jgi:6-phosphogluconolactonase
MEKLLLVVPDKQALSERALEIVVERINTALETRGICTLALAGGSTPKPVYEALSLLNLPWERLHIFWGDERYVSRDHPDSNQGMARQAWLDKIDIPPENIHPMPTDSQDAVLDAQKYETQLRQWFNLTGSEFPTFDLILLGMGDDGHTASLFPHTAALDVGDRSITVGDKDGQPRLTFTVPLINHARSVLFLVSGESKRPALAQVFAEVGDARAYPSRLIHPQGELIWLLDQAAGAALSV